MKLPTSSVESEQQQNSSHDATETNNHGLEDDDSLQAISVLEESNTPEDSQSESQQTNRQQPEDSNKSKDSASSSSLLASLLDKASKVSRAKLGNQPINPSLVEDQVVSNMKKLNTDKPVYKLRLAFLGGGSFGTAMSNLAARNGCDSTLWVRNKRTVRSMQKTRINKKYLPGFTLDERLKIEHDLKVAVQDKDIIFVAVPSSAFRETLIKIRPYLSGQSVVSLTKGIEKDSFNLMSDIIKQELPEVNYGVMSGPNLAIEIMQNMPSASVIASNSEPLRHAVQAALHSAFFRIFASDDVRGVELGGALKNIYAIAMGMAASYSVGENTKAMLLTRALAEMSRFGAASGANPLTFLGLSGVGDLYATCSSELSRNYRIGNMLGKGIKLDSAIKKLGQTAEGVNTIQQVNDQANKLGVYMPITHALNAVIFEDQAALGVALNLMESGFRSDVEFVMPHQSSNESLNAQMTTQTKP